MTRPSILALDIGTSSVRAGLYDLAGELISGTSYKVDTFDLGAIDGQMDADLALDRVISAIDQAHELIPADHSVEYAAACAFWHSLVVVGSDGIPTTPVLTWADTASREQALYLKRLLDADKVHRRTGSRFHSSYWPAKILKLRSEGALEVGVILSFSDYVYLRLFGTKATSVSMASGTGMFELEKCEWDDELTRVLEIDHAMLPDITRDRTLRLNPEYAERWPHFAAAEWFPAIGDGAADNIGVGCSTRGKVALMVATSGAMRVVYKGQPPAKISRGLWCYRVDRERVVIGGALSTGGSLYQWLRDNLKLPSDADEQIAGRLPDAHRLDFMPFLSGERGTGYHANARGAVLGLASASTALDILQAAMESVAYRFAEIFDQLSTITEITEITASGGALRDSPVWAQMIADVLGRDLSIIDVAEPASRGAVLLALESVGKIESIEQSPPSQTRQIKCRPDRRELYKKARLRHAAAYELLIK